MERRYKDPGSTLDYPVDWSDWLDDGDEIVTSEWIITPLVDEDNTLTIADGSGDVPAPSFNNERTTAFVSGGTLGHRYVLTNRVTTAEFRTEDRSRVIEVKEK